MESVIDNRTPVLICLYLIPIPFAHVFKPDLNSGLKSTSNSSKGLFPVQSITDSGSKYLPILVSDSNNQSPSFELMQII